MHIQSKLLARTFIVGASSDLGQPFRPKKLGLCWGKNRLSHYDIRDEGALPPSITNIPQHTHLPANQQLIRALQKEWLCNPRDLIRPLTSFMRQSFCVY